MENMEFQEISLEEVLLNIGFTRNFSGFEYNFGNWKLTVSNSYFDPFVEVYHFYGYFFTERKTIEISFKLPAFVESYEQGIVILSYYLRKAHFKNKPAWIDYGLANQDLLPWRKETVAYDKAPKAYIDHEWFRLIVKKLKLLAANSDENKITEFNFDGQILKVITNNELIAAPGKGEKWKQSAAVQSKALSNLSNRIYKRDALIYILENSLYIGGRCFKLN